MSIRIYQKKSGYWYGIFRDKRKNPKERWVSLGTKDGRAADQLLSSLKTDYYAKLFDPWTEKKRLAKNSILLSTACKKYLRDKKEGDGAVRAKTIAGYESVLRLFQKSFGVHDPMLKQIKPSAITDFVNSKRSGRTLNSTSRTTYLRTLRAFFSWAVERKYLESSPVPKSKKKRRRDPKKTPPFLTVDQYSGLLNAIRSDAILNSEKIRDGNEWLIQPIQFAVFTGLRRGEVCNLRWKSVHLNLGHIVVENDNIFNTKSGLDRVVPLAGDALQVIRDLAEVRYSDDPEEYVFKGVRGGRLNDDFYSKRFRYYRKLAGLPDRINVHALRHTFGSWAAMKGMDLYKLSKIMGHADIQTTMIYAHLHPDFLISEMERCFGDPIAA